MNLDVLSSYTVTMWSSEDIVETKWRTDNPALSLRIYRTFGGSVSFSLDRSSRRFIVGKANILVDHDTYVEIALRECRFWHIKKNI